jgi:hypothetical protein
MARHIETTIEEPFPVFFAHVACPSERRRDTAKGPFYAAGMRHVDRPEHRAFAEWRAAGLRAAGWTVRVQDVEK